ACCRSGRNGRARICIPMLRSKAYCEPHVGCDAVTSAESCGLGSTTVYLGFSCWGNRLDSGDVHRTFYALSRQIGLRGPLDSRGPRLQDFRHRFATNTLVCWYRSNQDPERRLPVLSAYLGHVHVADTQWYLSGSPELMREAMRRLEHRWEERR